MPLETDDSVFERGRGIGESCAVFGVFGPDLDVSRITFFGLFSMQHRGQESSGIAVANPEWIVSHVDMGLVSHVFNERTLRMLKGIAAIGHNRYSTTGDSKRENAQPVVLDHIPGKHLALAHNGNLVNTRELYAELQKLGIRSTATTDSVLMAHLILEEYKDSTIEEALMKALPRFRGAYSLALLTNNELIAARDPHGFRPLCIGARDNNFCIASESAAFPLVGAEFIREVEPGEIVIIDYDGLRALRLPEKPEPRHCMFEFFYFSRPDSHLAGKLLYKIRIKMGRELAKEAPVPADWVIGVPDSGIPAAIGFSDASGIKYAEGFVKNRYVGRTFIEPLQVFRDIGVRMKLNPLTEILEGKRVILVDDSIVRGSTMKMIVRLLRDVAGVTEVHVRLSSSAIRHPCYYGVDFGTREELIAANRTEAEICRFIGADSLHYLSIDAMVRATGMEKEAFCLACFNAQYPLKYPHQLQLHMLDTVPKFVLEQNGDDGDNDFQSDRPTGLPE
jgi:amidophosphoribosyltransferase